MGFWGSVIVEILGGTVTALLLGGGATWLAASEQARRHDERIADLIEDNRRWFRDRDARLKIDLARLAGEHAARGIPNSSIAEEAKLACKQQALHEYRDEISAKRRRYRELRGAEGGAHSLIRRHRSTPPDRFGLTDDQRECLSRWRAGLPDDDASPLRDPSDEPDLRRFEREGDPPIGATDGDQ